MVQTVASAFEFWIVIFQPKTNNQKKKKFVNSKIERPWFDNWSFCLSTVFSWMMSPIKLGKVLAKRVAKA